MRAKEFVIVEAPLAPGIFKYEHSPKKDRVPMFLQKLANQSPFAILTKNGTEEVIFDPSQYADIEAHLKNKNRKFNLRTVDGRLVPFGAIVKTKEFGGELAGSRENIEQGQIDGLSQELEQLKAGNPSINLVVGNNIVQAARFAKTTELVGGKQPKSDMTVYDESDNPVAWVSLKGANFKKWGGFQHLIPTSPEIQAWIAKIKEITGGVLGPKQAFGHHIKDSIIKNKIVFGKDFGGNFGISNVNAVLIGWATIKPSGQGKFALSADTVYSNGETPSGTYEPYLAVRFMTARPDIGLKNARAETNTKNETRRVQWLDNLQLTPASPNPASVPPGITNKNISLATSKIPMGSTP